MEIKQSPLSGVYTIKRMPFEDERGSFSRMFCRREFEIMGLCGEIAQANLSSNKRKGTLRGLHAQKGEHAEDKIVTCVSGEIFDVCVDVREGSPTFGQYYGEVLSETNGLSLFVPKGFAHGFLTLKDNVNVIYFVTQYYNSDAETGYHYKDPLFKIRWPLSEPYIISDKDMSWEYL